MANDTANDDVGEIELGDIVAASLGHGDILSAEGLSEFDHLLEASDLSEAEQQEFLQSIWNIIVSLIDHAWGDHPIQNALKASGKLVEIDSECDIRGDNMVQLKDNNLTKKYKKTAE